MARVVLSRHLGLEEILYFIVWMGMERHAHVWRRFTLLKLGKQRVGAMYPMTEDRKIAGVLPHWNSYVAVISADETAKNTTSLRGKVLREPFGADANRMANLQDPSGAQFCIWEINQQPQVTRLNEVGAVCWTELYTHDPIKAAEFYSGLFGWRPQPWKGGAMPYTMFHLADEDRPAGGMLAMTSEMPGPSYWLPYFQVEDADKSAEYTKELGGKICNTPMDIARANGNALRPARSGICSHQTRIGRSWEKSMRARACSYF